LYWPSTAWSTGNKDLKAEKGFDWDIGLNLRNPFLLNFAFDIVYFNMRVRDLIQWQSIDFVYMPVNIAKSANSGIENKSSIKPVRDVVTILFNYTYLDARDRSDNEDTKNKYLVYRPRSSFNLSINFQRDFLTIEYDYRYVGKRFTDTINAEYLDPYHVSDITLSLSRKFSSWQPILSLQVKNVFDQSYEVIKYQPMPGRELRVNLGISYN
jgi:outer membrane receptor protein involved in Fe transport